MRSQQMGSHYVLRLDEGEEAVASLRAFLVERNILAGRLAAWGAFRWLRLQHNRLEAGSYRPLFLELEGPLEVASLHGNVALLGDEPVLHAWVTVGDQQFRSYGGRLVAGTVGPTLEAVVTPLPRALHRFWSERLNMAILDPEEAPEEAERLEAWP